MQPENYIGKGIELTPTILKALAKNGWELVKTTNEPSVSISKQESRTTQVHVTAKSYYDLPEQVRRDAEHPYANTSEFQKALNPYRSYGPGRDFTFPYTFTVMKVWLLDDEVCRILNEAIHGHACINTEAFERLMQQNTDSQRIFKLTPNLAEAVYVYFDTVDTCRPCLIPGVVVRVFYTWEMQDILNALQALLVAPHIPMPQRKQET